MLFLPCNSAWGDQLTKYNGNQITYGANGNPISYYNGATFEWQGRQLVGAVYNSNTYTYTYDTNGMRTSRTKHFSDGTTEVTNYIYNGNLLVSEETNGNITVYVYDPSGSPIGFQYHKSSYAAGVWDSYYYVKNIQGDIVEIYNDNGIRVASYSYDEYGKPTARHMGSNYDITSINHLMYRGYYYDFKMHSNSSGFQGGLGLYYLGSRYYDANIGRFISPDDISYLGANGDLNAYNLYAYCSNNPIMYYDPSGHSAILIAIIVGAVVGGLFGFGTVAYTDYKDDGEVFNGSVEWHDYVSGTVFGGVAGAGITALGGASILIASSTPWLTNAGGAVAISVARANIAIAASVLGATIMLAYSGDWPGDDSTKAPSGFEWRGNGSPGSSQGNWYNPNTKEVLHPDLKHPKPIGPHWDFRDILGQWWRIFKNGKFLK